MNRSTLRSTAYAAAALTLALGASACAAGNESDDSGSDGGDSDLSGTLSGAGASSQQAVVEIWKSSFQSANSGVTVNYDPVGSGGGREQFIAGGTDFAGSDAALEGEELEGAKERCGGEVIQVPVYVSPIAIPFNLDGVDELNLSAETLGAIFAGDITRWSDQAIASDNPDADLPDSRITPVHRSDDSGTTENFTEYLDAASGGSWGEGVVETWPFQGGEAANGTSGVVRAVGNGNGTIGYADASQVGDLSTASVGVGEEFVQYSPEAAAAVLDASEAAEGTSETNLALDLDRETAEAGVYPIVLVSYGIACQTYDDEAKADLVKAWMSYVVGDGQEEAAEVAAPLSEGVADDATSAIETISAG